MFWLRLSRRTLFKFVEQHGLVSSMSELFFYRAALPCRSPIMHPGKVAYAAMRSYRW